MSRNGGLAAMACCNVQRANASPRIPAEPDESVLTGNFKKSGAPALGMARALPTFEGYTVDERLQEFRKASPATGLAVVPFDSVKGCRLLRRYLARRVRNVLPR